MKRLHLSLILIIFATPLFAQPQLQWQKSLGGSNAEDALCIQATNDGGCITAGYTLSQDGDVQGTNGIYDFWVVKLNQDSGVAWAKTLGGSNLDWPLSIQQTLDGGYIVAGFTESNDGDVSGNHGDKDAWVVKLNSSGVIEWQKAMGGSGWEEAWSINLTSDGGYIMCGRSSSNDGDVTGNHGGSLDCWVVKLNSTGGIEWQKSLGGSDEDTAKSIQQTKDGGYIMAGEVKSADGDVIGNHGDVDYWVVKLDAAGNPEWQKSLGGEGSDVATNIHELADGYIVSGYEGSGNTGNVTEHHGLFDYWVVKLDKTGGLIWQKTLGGSDADWGYTSVLSIDGSFIVAGTTRSNNGDVLNNDGGQDIWVLKLNGTGEISWQTTLGGSQAESGHGITISNDGGIVLAGRARSNDGDVTGNHGSSDFWVVKLSPESVNTQDLPSPSPATLEIHPNPASNAISLKTPKNDSINCVEIADMLGREMLRFNTPGMEGLEVGSLPNGVYLLTATGVSGKRYTGMLYKKG